MERLAPSVRDRLVRAGFRSVADVAELSPVHLAQGERTSTAAHTAPAAFAHSPPAQAMHGCSVCARDSELGCTPEEAMAILRSAQQAHGEPIPAGVSAVELLKREAAAASIRTGAAGLDGLLGTGVPVSKLTECCGAPGVGKTQLG